MQTFNLTLTDNWQEVLQGGSSPYDEPFTIDLTSIATWTLQMGIDVTATAS